MALADTHKAWSSQSYQTLQRVGSIIRSTSMDCLAALGKKGGGMSAAGGGPVGASQQPASGAPLPSGDDEQDEDSIVRANLSRFLTAASDAEVSQAARMSDLSNMAYDVLDVTAARLQEAHGLTLVAHSRASGTSTAQAGPTLQEQLQQLQDNAEQQHPFLLAQLPAAAPWPVPLMLLQGPGAGVPMPAAGADFSSGLPASPRTPAVMASYGEDEYAFAEAAQHQAVPATGCCPDPGSPRRQSAAAAAGAAGSGGVAVATMGMPAAPAMGDAPPAGYMQQPVLSRQHSLELISPQYSGVQYPQHPDEQLSLDEAALLQQLKQQEAFILLELQASQQMLLLLQQPQQQVHLHDGSSVAAAAAAAPADLQQLQEIAASASSITAAASTAAAAALAGSSLFEGPAAPASPRRSSISSSSGGGDSRAPLDAVAATAAELSEAPADPSDWFCCDGPLSPSDATPTRFFAIQGSITLDHWRINLAIDPVEFEAGALGPIRVHRGMYGAALTMYDTLLPLVQQHLAAHPAGKIALTGHSLGGSLAALLMLLMVHRGDLPVANVATVYTFGAPAVFCEGANGSPPTPGSCQSCSLPCEHRKAAAATSSATDSLLSKLELPADAVVNVIMTRDIVPRAFVCDYTLVAGVLKSWLPSFKEHKGLAACKSHKALYNFIGVVEVLQPSKECDFVLPDEGHDMLPPSAALYKLTEPQQQQQRPAAAAAAAVEPGAMATPVRSSPLRGSFNSLSSLTNISGLSSVLAELTSSFSLGGSSSSRGSSSAGDAAHPGDDDAGSSSSLGMVAVPVADAPLAPLPSAAAAAAAAAFAADVSPFADVQEEHSLSPAAALALSGAASKPPAPGGSSRGVVAKSPEGLTLGDAILTFMNSPHPLQTLGEMRAYGHNGSISRYHNPNSYTKALQKLSGV